MDIGFTQGVKEIEKHKIVVWQLNGEQKMEKRFLQCVKGGHYVRNDSLKNHTSPKVVLFKCRWFDVYNEGRGIKRDKLGGTLINVTRNLHTNKPFTLACQIRQVFYIAAHNDPQWKWVINMNPHYYFDFPSVEDIDGNTESLWENMEVVIANLIKIQEGDDEEIPLVRDDVEPDIVDADIVDANLVDVNFIQDSNDENDEDGERG